MVVLGLMFGLVVRDVNSGIRRFNFGFTGLADGIEFVALSMALYGLADIAINLEKNESSGDVTAKIGRVWPSWSDIKYCIPSVLRGTGLGSLLGVLPAEGHF